MQAPATHCWPAAHARPQAPQFVRLVCRSTQLVPQAAKPTPSQLPPQTPFVQAPSAAVGHTLPQAPQFAASVDRSTHPSAHSVRPAEQVQTPPAQACPSPQATPQPPQFSGSLTGSTQTSPQAIWPVRQAPSGQQIPTCPATSTSPSGVNEPQRSSRVCPGRGSRYAVPRAARHSAAVNSAPQESGSSQPPAPPRCPAPAWAIAPPSPLAFGPAPPSPLAFAPAAPSPMGSPPPEPVAPPSVGADVAPAAPPPWLAALPVAAASSPAVPPVGRVAVRGSLSAQAVVSSAATRPQAAHSHRRTMAQPIATRVPGWDPGRSPDDRGRPGGEWHAPWHRSPGSRPTNPGRRGPGSGRGSPSGGARLAPARRRGLGRAPGSRERRESGAPPPVDHDRARWRRSLRTLNEAEEFSPRPMTVEGDPGTGRRPLPTAPRRVPLPKRGRAPPEARWLRRSPGFSACRHRRAIQPRRSSAKWPAPSSDRIPTGCHLESPPPEPIPRVARHGRLEERAGHRGAGLPSCDARLHTSRRSRPPPSILSSPPRSGAAAPARRTPGGSPRPRRARSRSGAARA
jgi:hypothetical protein